VWEQRGATLAQAQVAHQQVLHDASYRSRVVLPVIPLNAELMPFVLGLWSFVYLP